MISKAFREVYASRDNGGAVQFPPQIPQNYNVVIHRGFQAYNRATASGAVVGKIDENVPNEVSLTNHPYPG